MTDIDNISVSILSMKSMGNVKSRLKRCRSLRVASEFMNMFKPDHEDRTGGGVVVHGKGNVNKPSDSDSHREESCTAETVG